MSLVFSRNGLENLQKMTVDKVVYTKDKNIRVYTNFDAITSSSDKSTVKNTYIPTICGGLDTAKITFTLSK